MCASRGDPRGCGVFMALCMALAPFEMWAKPGEGACWSEACGCGEEVICWLRPECVRDGIWRTVRFLGDCSIDGDGMVGGGCGVGVPAGESLGDNRELISILTNWLAMPSSYARDGTRDSTPLSLTTFTSIQGILCTTFGTVANYTLCSRPGRVWMDGMGRRREGAALRSVGIASGTGGGRMNGYRMRPVMVEECCSTGFEESSRVQAWARS
jgi:hypothetical protein